MERDDIQGAPSLHNGIAIHYQLMSFLDSLRCDGLYFIYDGFTSYLHDFFYSSNGVPFHLSPTFYCAEKSCEWQGYRG